MFSKAIYASIFVSTLVLQGHAHAGVTPALGVSGTFARSDVQRPSTATPCGTTPLTDIDTSTAAPVNPDGSVDLTATNFNAGADGSRSFTATISADGTTKNMVAAQVTTNGDAAPTNVGSQPLVVQIPPGTTCTGGKDKKRCIVSLQSTSGFGNCVAIIQSGAGGAAGNSTAAAAGNSTAAAATGNNTAAGVDNAGKKHHKHHHHHAHADNATATDAANATATDAGAADPTATNTIAARAPSGARAVRSLLAGSEGHVKRGSFSWIWA